MMGRKSCALYSCGQVVALEEKIANSKPDSALCYCGRENLPILAVEEKATNSKPAPSPCVHEGKELTYHHHEAPCGLMSHEPSPEC